MDTAFNLPFDAYLIVNPTTYPQKVCLGPWGELLAGSLPEITGAAIQENDEIDLYFNSTDSDARLYLDALECCPITSRILVDEDGLIYCTPADEVIKIYRNDSNYDALRIDTLQMSVLCDSKTYVSFLQVVPKQMSSQEWTIMRDDLEEEIRGLAQDIVRRTIGSGSGVQGILPPDDLYAFLIINKNAQAIMSALLDIKDCPKYRLEKHYEEADESKKREIDKDTVKHYLRRGAPNNMLLVPRRDTVYDIPENRLLKKIVKNYDEKLGRFITIIKATLDYRTQRHAKHSKQSMYDAKYIEGLAQYLETAEKLKKITNIIKNAEWFREVRNPEGIFIPHSVAVDSRYGTLYRVYTEMNKHKFTVQLDPQYSYSWKKSSSLYEMWCFICVCRQFLSHYSPVGGCFEQVFTKDQLFPFLESGTKITVEDEHAIIEIIYDVVLPRKSDSLQKYQNPLYLGRHNRPDICINMYSKMSGWYVGSYIIECKYRSLSAFWYGKTWSSREQIRAYHNDSKSPLFLNGILNHVASSRPVHKVFVFTPDEFNTRTYQDDKVDLLTFKPAEDQHYATTVCGGIIQEVKKKVESADGFFESVRSANLT